MNRLLRLRATWNPDMYHGWGKTHSNFEGWYFKIADPLERSVFAVIPGISKDKNGKAQAFIQVLDGKLCRASYHHFDAAEFQPSTQKFELRLGKNFFSAEQIELDLPELRGQISMQQIYPWPKMLGAPGIMGWYSFMPFMECYHGVVSMHHRLSGSLAVHGEPTDFTGGKGYIEKDWGTSFPRSWIWMQSNHFDDAQRVSLMASVAHIPWLGNYFIGYIVGFLLGDKLYRFATYTGAQMKAALNEERVLLSFRDRRHRIEIEGRQGPGAALRSPITGEMTGKVNESMQGNLTVRFFENEQLIFEGTGRNAGLEVAGEVAELLTERWRR